MMPGRVAARTVIIGIGNPMRRDDGVGLAAVARLGKASGRVDLAVLDGEPTRLLEIWRDRDTAIVVDAATCGGAAGTIHRLDVAVDPIPPPKPPASSHGAGLAEAVELGRALDALPGRLIVYGVEPEDLSFGEGLSPSVGGALDELVVKLLAEVEWREGAL